MRRNRSILLSGAVVGTAIIVAITVWLRRCPIRLRVVEAAPASLFYFGEKQGMQVTFTVRNSDSIGVIYEIPAFEASIEGRWIEWQLADGIPGMTTAARGWLDPGGTNEAKLVLPEGTKCRLRVRYASGGWKSRFGASIGSTGQRWVAKSPRLAKMVLPEKFGALPLPLSWKTNTVELIIHQKPAEAPALPGGGY